MNTNNISDLGSREIHMLNELNIAFNDYDFIKEGYSLEGLKWEFNMSSGYMFFVNDECEILMLDGDKLERFYTLYGTGYEGFADELLFDYENGNITDGDDIEQLQDLGIIPTIEEKC